MNSESRHLIFIYNFSTNSYDNSSTQTIYWIEDDSWLLCWIDRGQQKRYC